MPSGEPDRARHADGTWGKVDMPDCPDLKRLNFAGFAERRFRSVLSLSLSLCACRHQTGVGVVECGLNATQP